MLVTIDTTKLQARLQRIQRTLKAAHKRLVKDHTALVQEVKEAYKPVVYIPKKKDGENA